MQMILVTGVYSPISISGGSTNAVWIHYRHQGGASNRLSILEFYVNRCMKNLLISYTYAYNATIIM